MKLKLFFTLFILFSTMILAQYPYEKGNPVAYKYTGGWETEVEGKTYNSNIPGFFGSNKLKIRMDFNFKEDEENAQIKIEFYEKNKLIYTLHDNGFAINFSDIYTADFNNDGLTDIKFEVWTGGVGLGALSNHTYYIMQNKNKTFSGVAFYNMDTRKEYDLNKDGIYEIITCSHEEIEKHSFWVYNLYNLIGGKLVNVNNKLNYPIFIQHLIKDNYNPAVRIQKKYASKFNFSTPPEYRKLY